MADFKDKISHIIKHQVPEFVLEDHPYFLDFVKEYYKFLECAEIKLTDIGTPNSLLLENQTTNINRLVLNATNRQKRDDGDNLLLEDSTIGDFINGEIITGSTSGATTTVLIEDIDANSRLFVSHDNKFEEGETITGSTSGATATISTYRANPVQNIQQLLDYPDPDKVIQSFLTKFRNAFLQSIPETLTTGLDKRKLIKNVKSLYRAKGTKRASEIFFRLLFNENANLTFPKDNMLRVSDGKWDTQKVLRCTEVGTSDALNLIGQTITQANNPGDAGINLATAIVENVFKFSIGGETIVEIVLNEDSIVGTFVSGQNITGVDNTNEDSLVTCTLEGSIATKTITNDGVYYNVGDQLVITGGGNGAVMTIDAVGSGPITEIFVDSGGSNYEIGDTVNFSSSNATAKVSVVNGGIGTEEGTSGATDGTDHIILEDETVRGDPYTGNKIVQETDTGTGDITDVRIINGGDYSSLPSLTITSTSGSGASIFASGSEIGKVQKIKTTELGANYADSPSPPTLTLPTYLLLRSRSGAFTVGETISGLDASSTVVTATVVSLDTNTNVLKCSGANGIFAADTVITGGTSAVTATIQQVDQATATSTVAVVVDTDGAYINQDGHVSETSMVIQDSLLYQDYSYIIQVGRSINDWRDTYKKTLHSAGFYFQGEVDIQTQLDMRIRNVTGLNTNVTEEILGVIRTVFTTILGRRLGTVDDGTTLRSNPLLGVAADLDDSTSEHFPANTRDLTLRRAFTIGPMRIKHLTSIRSNTSSYGVPVAGPTLKGINHRLMGGYMSTQYTIDDITNLRLMGTLNSDIDGELNNLSDFEFKLKHSLAIPAEVFQVSGDSFDETFTFFDTTTTTFDKA
jgi:hypothetical protein